MGVQDLAIYLQSSPLLDYESEAIVALVAQRGWAHISSITDRIEAIYTMVRDEIPYGYTAHFKIPGSEVLTLGMGNCLTKTTLLMTLLRAAGVPCRMEAATVGRILHRGLLKGVAIKLSPRSLFHSWVSVYYRDRWVELGGHIVDRPYLLKLQARYPDYMGSFYGYGIATLNFRNPPIKWEGEETSIQDKAIRGELGSFPGPDSFFAAHPEAERRTWTLGYKLVLRPTLNKSIRRVREG
jgi:transglutaminase-like putative cysteine protease